MGTSAMRLNRGGYLIREGFRSITTHSFMSFASVAITVACLLIMGTVSLLALNIDALIESLESQNEIVAFVDENITDAETLEAIRNQIEMNPNVESVQFIDRKEAMESFLSQHDDYMREGLDEEVFRHRFVVHLLDLSIISETTSQLELVGGIAHVRAHTDYASKFITMRNIITAISLVLIVILVFVSFFIMSNTIKLTTFGRRNEIAIMKMVGATNGFIRLPFVIEGLVLGAAGGGLAFLAQWGLYQAIADSLLGAIGENLFSAIPFNSVAMPIFCIYMATGVFVGMFGGVNAIRNYLNV